MKVCLSIGIWIGMLVGSVVAFPAHAQQAFSTAGFYAVPESPRQVLSLNPGWRFHRGDLPGAENPELDDSDWPVVNLPHGIEPLPLEASGSQNYQGVIWYRKQFDVPPQPAGQRRFLHFEAIMGKSKIWVNGQLVAEHFGGYLPIHIDVTDQLVPGASNQIAVWADNSDDPTFPPGRPQTALDFAYFGGIYRDVWLVTTAPVFVTHANRSEGLADGGVFFHTDALQENSATTSAKLHLQNTLPQPVNLSVTTRLVDDAGSIVAESVSPLTLAAGAEQAVTQQLQVEQPQLWSPETPQLYDLQVAITDSAGTLLDALKLRVGIRTFALRGPEGFFLNGKPYPHKLLGGNRHQDHAFLGNALSNNLHFRDAQKLRSAGMRIIRSAHYPQDPAFMDACDQLGMFVIVATPGWQFYQDGIFAERVLLDVRQMVRRDRNRACLFGFEPVLNETNYPGSLSEEAAALVQAEYPYEDVAIACDSWASGAASFRLMYNVSAQADQNAILHRKNHPYSPEYLERVKRHYRQSSFLIREFGDNTNDWVAHDSTSRIAKEWGEAAQLVQLQQYDSAVRKVLALGKQDLGGCLWHPFDHQRGYHTDPFWGGLLDAARQPKYSYWMFMAQRDPELTLAGVATGPFVKILHETTAVSAAPIHVSSNCEAVHLVVYGKDCGTLSTHDAELPAYRKIVTFENAYDFMDQKKLLRAKRPDEAIVVAEGLIGGQVVCQQVLQYANARQKIELEVDADLERFCANGSDLLPVVAYVCDERGNRKRLGSNLIEFEVEGQATLFGAGADPNLGINPQTTRWGEAIALVRSTRTPGEVTIRARELSDSPTTLEPATLTVRTRVSDEQALYAELPAEQTRTDQPRATSTELEALQLKLRATEKELLKLRQQETARGQEQHETGH